MNKNSYRKTFEKINLSKEYLEDLKRTLYQAQEEQKEQEKSSRSRRKAWPFAALASCAALAVCLLALAVAPEVWISDESGGNDQGTLQITEMKAGRAESENVSPEAENMPPEVEAENVPSENEAAGEAEGQEAGRTKSDETVIMGEGEGLPQGVIMDNTALSEQGERTWEEILTDGESVWQQEFAGMDGKVYALTDQAVKEENRISCPAVSLTEEGNPLVLGSIYIDIQGGEITFEWTEEKETAAAAEKTEEETAADSGEWICIYDGTNS